MRRVAAGQDLVIAATRPAPGHEHELVAATSGLLTGLRGTGVRLLVVGGAGTYRTATDTLITDRTGTSRITPADLAVALLDEAEHPRHEGIRFTVAY